MISDLMLFANPPKPIFQTCKLSDVTQSVIEELQLEFASCRTQIEFLCDESLETVCDPTQIAEAIKALVRNSIEATPQTGLISVELQLDDDGNTRFRVRDSGSGINDKIAHHMFDPFFSGREAGRGLGFGLCKAWRIARLHGGQLKCMSREPGNTCFEFQWPRLENVAAAA
jgi:signal transduction histidine kinase